MRKRQGANGGPAYAGAGSGSPFGGSARTGLGQDSRPMMPPAAPAYGSAPSANLDAPSQTAVQPSVPEGFDTEAFTRNAMVYFVRLQDAWDRGNVNDIREFTTPEMFAEIKLDVDARGSAPNRTDVVQLNADVLGVEDRQAEYLASVRFHGLIRESEGASAEPFVEVWNLSKQKSGNEGWLLAGIQQVS
jgi:predicted lipid-binding transport protein (Tim44 family)